MIAKGSTTIVNFYVTDTDGIPATGQASNISASINIDGGSATTISATISEKDSTNLPGWYEFEYTFSTAGNAFITFSCSGCIIMPWEEQVVEVSTSSAPSASDIANAVWTKDIDSYNYNTTPGMAYKYLKGFDLLLTNVSFAISDIPAGVWNYSSGRTITNTIPSASTIANEVWSYTVTNYNTTGQAGYVLRNTGALVWGYAGSRLVTNTIPTAEQIASSVWGAQYRELTSDLATASDLSSVASNVAAVKAKTDQLPASPAATGDAMTLTSAYDAAKTASQLTSADLPSDYAKPGDAMTLTSTYDAAKTASQLTSADLPSDYAKPGDAMTLTSAYDAAKTASQLTSADLPSDYAKPGDAMTLTSAYDAAKTASQLTSADLPSDYAKPGDAMTLTSAYNAAKTAAQAGDAMTLTSAYDAAKTASQLTSADLPSDYAKPGDAMTLTSAYDAAKTASQLTSADLPSDYAKPGDAMTLTSAYNAAKTAAQAGDAMTLTSTYDAAKTASQLTSADIPSDYAKPGDAMTLTSAYDAAKTASQLTSADLSGLSTFDPTTDTVLIDATQAATMTTATGFATSSDVSGAVSALETYGDNHWNGGGSGGATAQQIWEYPGPRSLNVSPTDVSGLATSSALSAVASDVSDIKAKTDNLPASPAAVGSAMTLTANYDAAKTAAQAGDAMTLTSAYDAAKTASQLTSADLPSDYAKPGDAMTLTSAYDAAKTASQFDAGTDAVNLSVNSVNAVQSGLANGSDIATINEIINKIYAGLFEWTVNADTLTIKTSEGVTIKTYYLTRDANNSIVKISENYG